MYLARETETGVGRRSTRHFHERAASAHMYKLDILSFYTYKHLCIQLLHL